jgi:hypothetical protein
MPARAVEGHADMEVSGLRHECRPRGVGCPSPSSSASLSDLHVTGVGTDLTRTPIYYSDSFCRLWNPARILSTVDQADIDRAQAGLAHSESEGHGHGSARAVRWFVNGAPAVAGGDGGGWRLR